MNVYVEVPHINGRTQCFQNIAQRITLPLPACVLPIVLPGAVSFRYGYKYASCCPIYVKDNVIHQTRPPFPLLLGPGLMLRCPLLALFFRWTGVRMDSLTGLWICSKLRFIVCDFPNKPIFVETSISFNIFVLW